MPKKRILLMMIFLLLSLGVSGCIDLFYVPGIGVSPDGAQLYFLQPFDLSGESSSDEIQFSTAPFNGTATSIMEAFGAFTVNPSTGTVVFSSGLQEGEIDQTFLMRYEDGEARLFVGPEAFEGKNFLATQLKYSQDGSKLAMTGIVAPPNTDLDTLGDADNFDPTQIELFDSVVYLVDVNSGALTLVSDPEAAWANTLDWSPDGRYIAYNGWVDSNGDGLISTAGGFASMMGGGGGAADASRIHIYDTSSGSTTVVDGAGTAYSPVWVNNDQVAYVELDDSSMMFGGGGNIMLSDTSGTPSAVFQPTGMVLGMALSPDGSQVAWTQLGAGTSMMSGADPESSEAPNELWISDTSFSNPQSLLTVSTAFGFLDAPVWMPDGSSILITSTNFLATFMGSFAGAFSAMGEGFAEGLGGEEVEGLDEIPEQQIEIVNISTGESTVVYTGAMINGNFVASVFGLVGGGDFSSMMGGMEGLQ